MGQIEVQDLTKDYGSRKGIFQVNFSVEKGEIFGFLGPNGAGKTTTIRHLMGFIRPDSGSVSIKGMDCFEKREEIQKILGYLPGEISLLDQMTGTEYLNFMAGMKGLRDRSYMNELITYFELDPRSKILKMSKGMKQKLAIVCAFMQKPEILILDEPTSGLDPLMQIRFIDLLLEEKKRGVTILMSSHIFEEVEKTCDRTAIIREGRLATIENMNTLAEKKKKVYTVTFTDGQAARNFAEAAQKYEAKVLDHQVQLSAGGRPGEVLKKIALADPVDVDIKSQSLEELFLHFYDKEEA
ncbi:ABC transporter ATP-binding protein [Cuneatibacter caecimuris]|uniref:ABC-2 type transport system ATP-binding protein n=1 Tax=Cuneatibacter caecimuris TaxID=1796618 RepID=A0A4Q7NZS7_9FIRM|nr:ATP-binding cassette domain-containing protein [Cuneatibacter caecimuris]RZS93011.1 ABC-2 type transport system ATP-binding protein [Cuneatibacter caecimuris]